MVLDTGYIVIVARRAHYPVLHLFLWRGAICGAGAPQTKNEFDPAQSSMECETECELGTSEHRKAYFDAARRNIIASPRFSATARAQRGALMLEQMKLNADGILWHELMAAGWSDVVYTDTRPGFISARRHKISVRIVVMLATLGKIDDNPFPQPRKDTIYIVRYDPYTGARKVDAVKSIF
jgi:hypothetical protein